jgi:P27 family predicted phage terminase small subunit
MVNGRPPKPTLIKAAEGNRGHSRRGNPNEKLANEPTPLRGYPECPDALQGDAREAWAFLTEQIAAMNLDHMPDAYALEMACAAFGAYRDAQRKINEKGILTVAKTGWEQQSAAVPVAMSARKEFLVFCNHFGLTPAARARLSVGGGDDELAKMEEMLSKPRKRA